MFEYIVIVPVYIMSYSQLYLELSLGISSTALRGQTDINVHHPSG